MKTPIFLALIFVSFTNYLAAQITENPAVKKKSASDVFINKLEITDNFTILSMKFVSKSVEKQIVEYLNANPDLKRKFERADSYTQRMFFQQLAAQFSEGSNSISIQPSSYLLSKDGRKFKFIKASGIPVKPESQVVEPDKRYYFKVYFEKLPKGIEEVDFIESPVAKNGSMNFWNLYGIEVNNPAENEMAGNATEPIINEEKDIKDAIIMLHGRVLDSETNEPVSAKIVCIAQDSNVKFDSLTTSKSGKYEFAVSPDNYIYKITADDYETGEEAFDLSNFKQSNTFERDFYLSKYKMQSEVPPMIEDVIAVEDIEPISVDESTFRLDKVYFETGQSTILANSYAQLEGLMEMLKENPKMKIQVEGHTDNQGDSKLNKKLSLERAFKVREYLMQKGIAGNRIKFKGYGDSKPISPNDSEENRMKNRRVEFKILDK